MRILASFFILFASLSCIYADDEGPVCKKCQKIREYNAAHPENNYYWYDDYVKEKKEDSKSTEGKTTQPVDKESSNNLKQQS